MGGARKARPTQDETRQRWQRLRANPHVHQEIFSRPSACRSRRQILLQTRQRPERRTVLRRLVPQPHTDLSGLAAGLTFGGPNSAFIGVFQRICCDPEAPHGTTKDPSRAPIFSRGQGGPHRCSPPRAPPAGPAGAPSSSTSCREAYNRTPEWFHHFGSMTGESLPSRTPGGRTSTPEE